MLELSLAMLLILLIHRWHRGQSDGKDRDLRYLMNRKKQIYNTWKIYQVQYFMKYTKGNYIDIKILNIDYKYQNYSSYQV